MTKRFGTLVGAVKQLGTFRPVDTAYEHSSDHVLVRDTITLAAAAINDTVQLGVFGWETVINPNGDVWHDALGAGVTLSIGDITFPTALMNAEVCTAAGSAKITKALTLDKYFAPLWQALGYADLKTAQAVGAQCELLAKVGVGAATGIVSWQLTGQPRI